WRKLASSVQAVCQTRQQRCQRGPDQRGNLQSLILHVSSPTGCLPALIITFDLPAQVEFPGTRCCSQISAPAASAGCGPSQGRGSGGWLGPTPLPRIMPPSPPNPPPPAHT